MAEKVDKGKEKQTSKWLIIFFKSIKMAFYIICRIVCFASLVTFIVIPFLSHVIDHYLAQFLWYPSLIVTFIIPFLPTKKWSKKQNKLDILKAALGNRVVKTVKISITVCLIIIIAIVFINNYYLLISWAPYIWTSVVFTIFCFSSIPFFICLYKEKRITGNDLFETIKNCFYAVIIIMLTGLSILAITKHWTPLVFYFGIPLVISLYWKLIHDFLSSEHFHVFGRAFNIFISIFGLCFALGLTVYMIYLIPDDLSNLQGILTTIVASFLGGSFTLVGVAWTIRRQDAIRQEEERKKYYPIVNLYTIHSVKGHTVTINPKDNTDCTIPSLYKIENFEIKNTDFSSFFLGNLAIDGEIFTIDPLSFIDKKWVVKFDASKLRLKSAPSNIAISIRDMLGNNYIVKLDFVISADNTIKIIGCYDAILNNKETH